MGKKNKTVKTSATRALESAGVDFLLHSYEYVERGGTRVSAESLGVDEHRVVKTLVFQTDKKDPFVICMHGDLEVSEKELARALGVRKVRPCDPATAQRHSGYQVGGTSPFGTRKKLPTYLESSVLDLERIWINAGARGLLAEIEPRALIDLCNATPVRVARKA